jgi:hypothetical protein
MLQTSVQALGNARPGHKWLLPVLDWLDDEVVAAINLGDRATWAPVRLTTAGVLAAYTYDSVAQTITFNAVGAQSVDGIDTALNDRIGYKDGLAGLLPDNGIYTVTTKGVVGTVAEVWTRAIDANESDEFTDGKMFSSGEGTLAGRVYEFKEDAPFTLDTTDVVFEEISNVMLQDAAQTVTGAKSYSATMLRVWNGGGTFTTQFSSSATANRAVTFPDAAGVPVLTDVVPTAAGEFPRASGSNTWVKSTLTLPNAMAQGSILHAATADAATALPLGATGTIPRSNGTTLAYSTATFPDGVAGAGQILRASGANVWAASTATYPDTPVAVGDILLATGAGVYGHLTAGADKTLVCGTGAGSVPAYESSPVVSGSFSAETSLLTPILDTVGATALAVAPTTATSLDLAATGITSTVKGPLVCDEGASITGNLSLTGRLIQTGSPLVTQAEFVTIADNHLFLNAGYTTAVAQTAGLVANYLPTATTDTVAATGFVAGVNGVSDPYVNTTAAAAFAQHDLVEITGAGNPANNGIREVQSSAGNVLTIKSTANGITNQLEDWTDGQFVTDTTVAGTITKVGFSGLRCGTDGKWEVAFGNATGAGGLTFGNLYYVGGDDVAVADGGTGASTATAGFDALSPVTTRGDLIVRDASNNVRLAVGATAGMFLRSDATDAAWSTLVLPNAIARGGLLRGSAVANTAEALAVGGSAGMFLRTDATDLEWSTLTLPNAVAGAGQLMRATGANAFGVSTSTFADTYASQSLLYASSANTVVGLGIGAAHQALVVDTFGTSIGWSALALNQAAATSGRLPLNRFDDDAAGKILRAAGLGADPTWSTATFPDTATGAGRFLRASGANAWAESTATLADTYSQGDLLHASAANAVSGLAAVASGQVLTSAGVGTAPAWSASPSITNLTASGTVNIDDGGLLYIEGNGTGTGDVVERLGGSATEGLEKRVYQQTVSPSAIETNLINLPAGAVVLSVQGNVEVLLVAGGTSVTWSIGTAADPDKYGTQGNPGAAADSLLQNSKSSFLPAWAMIGAGGEQMVLTAAATGGAADGDTAFSAGSVRVRVVYYAVNDLDNA